MNCDRCGGPMAALFTSLYCARECDKRPAEPLGFSDMLWLAGLSGQGLFVPKRWRGPSRSARLGWIVHLQGCVIHTTIPSGVATWIRRVGNPDLWADSHLDFVLGTVPSAAALLTPDQCDMARSWLRNVPAVDLPAAIVFVAPGGES